MGDIDGGMKMGMEIKIKRGMEIKRGLWVRRVGGGVGNRVIDGWYVVLGFDGWYVRIF